MSQEKAYLELGFVEFPNNTTKLTTEELNKKISEYVQGEMDPNTTLTTEWGMWCLEEHTSELDSLIGEAISLIREEEEEELDFEEDY